MNFEHRIYKISNMFNDQYNYEMIGDDYWMVRTIGMPHNEFPSISQFRELRREMILSMSSLSKV